MCMMLGYVHNTTKIWRIWDFKSGKIGRAVEYSSVVFVEEENAHTEEQRKPLSFQTPLMKHRPTERRTKLMK